MGFVLVFEDHPIAGIALRETLENAGHRAIQTGDYAEALRVLTTELPDVIVIDLAHARAWWLLDDVRTNARLSLVPVVVATHELDERLWGRAELALRKPYRMADLLIAVRAFAPIISTIDRRRRTIPVAVDRRRSAA